MRQRMSPTLGGGLPPTGPVTFWLCGIMVAVSVGSSVSQRLVGMGVELLTFSPQAVLHGEVWRLATYGFVKTSPMGLALSALVLWLMGRSCEATWGSRDYLRFVLASMVGAAALAIPLSALANAVLPFLDIPLPEGPDAAIDAMIVALALAAPQANVLLGFVLPIPVRTLLWILPVFSAVSGLMTGACSLSSTLSGMAMGYLLVTGVWRPSRLFERLRLYRLQRRRRDGLYVVPPRNKRDLN